MQQHHAGGGSKRPPPPPLAARGEAERKADEAVVALLRRLQRLPHKEGKQQQQQEEGQELELNGLGLQRLPDSLLRHLELETGHHNGASGLSLGHRLRRLSLRSNLLSSLPRELIYLRNLEVLNLDGNRLESLCAEVCNMRNLRELTLEGNEGLAELPDLSFFPSLQVLRVPTTKRYPIPRDVSAGGGEAVLSYLRAYERVAREQKLPLRFDPEAHYQRSTTATDSPSTNQVLTLPLRPATHRPKREAPPIPFLDREWERVQQQQHNHQEAARRTVCHECADALHASPLKKSFEVAPVLSRVRTFDEVFDALSKGPTKEGAAPYNGSGSRRISLSMDRGENGGSSSRPPRSGPLGHGASPREGRQQQQGREEAGALAARLREVEGQLSARDDDLKAARRQLAEARELVSTLEAKLERALAKQQQQQQKQQKERHRRESDRVRELTQALEEAQERAARAEREAQRRVDEAEEVARQKCDEAEERRRAAEARLEVLQARLDEALAARQAAERDGLQQAGEGRRLEGELAEERRRREAAEREGQGAAQELSEERAKAAGLLEQERERVRRAAADEREQGVQEAEARWARERARWEERAEEGREGRERAEGRVRELEALLEGQGRQESDLVRDLRAQAERDRAGRDEERRRAGEAEREAAEVRAARDEAHRGREREAKRADELAQALAAHEALLAAERAERASLARNAEELRREGADRGRREAQHEAAVRELTARVQEAEKAREAAVAELRQKAHEWRMREEALLRQAEHARNTEEALLAHQEEAERRKRTQTEHATALAALQDRIDELQARLADAQAQLLKANTDAAASKDVAGGAAVAAAAPSSTQPGALGKAMAAAASEELARVVAERARLEERLKDARARVMEVIEESGAAVAEERRRVKELEDLNFQQRKKIADLAARLELVAAGCPPSTATTATPNVAAAAAASSSAKREEGLLAEKELVRLRERTRDLEHALERKGRRESQMIVQLQQLEMREREREEAERRTREHEAVCAEWARKEALARQERERLQAALADEARQRREERERERAKTQRMVCDLETLEAQLEQLRVRQADHQRLEARVRDLDALRATLEARLRGEGRAESEVVTDLRARLDAADQRHADLAAQLAQATLGRDSLHAQVHALQRQLDHNSTAQAREQELAHLQARLAEVQQPAAAPPALTPTEGGHPPAAAAGEAPPPARSVSDRTLVGKPSASLESKRSMSLEETARRIKHLKQELKNAKKAKKVLKRSSSRGSSRGSSDSFSSSTDDDESELESDFSETETETETDEASDAEGGEGGAGNTPSSGGSSGKSRKKRLGKWARLSISNVRDLASRDSSSSSSTEAAASSGGSSALPPATASSAATGKAITRHKRSLSFLAGRKKSTDSASASASSSDDDSEASELDTESENEGEAKEKKVRTPQKASESTGRPQRGHRRSHSLLGGMTKFLPGGDDGKAGEKDDGREKEKAREEKERKRREKEQKRKEREELIRQLKKEERQERKKEREKKGRTSRKKPLKGREVFGVGIRELCEKDPTHPIPQVVKLIAEYLESSGAMEVEGLFRVPGQSVIMSRLKDDFDAAGLGNEATVAASFLDYDSHDVAGLLKLFLKMLPEPVMTHALYDDFVRLQVEFEKKGGDDTASAKAEHLANFVALLRRLPPDNLRFFLFLAKFLHKVSLVSEKNKMSAGNLAIVFAPNLLCPATPDLNYQMRMPTLSALVEFAIAHAYALAMHLDNTAKPPKPATPGTSIAS